MTDDDAAAIIAAIKANLKIQNDCMTRVQQMEAGSIPRNYDAEFAAWGRAAYAVNQLTERFPELIPALGAVLMQMDVPKPKSLN